MAHWIEAPPAAELEGSLLTRCSKSERYLESLLEWCALKEGGAAWEDVHAIIDGVEPLASRLRIELDEHAPDLIWLEKQWPTLVLANLVRLFSDVTRLAEFNDSRCLCRARIQQHRERLTQLLALSQPSNFRKRHSATGEAGARLSDASLASTRRLVYTLAHREAQKLVGELMPDMFATRTIEK